MWYLAMDEIGVDYDLFPWRTFKNHCVDSIGERFMIWTGLLWYIRKMLLFLIDFTFKSIKG